MSWTLPGLVVLGVILLFGWFGFRRGFVKEIVSAVFIALAIAVVWLINPYVNQFLKENTPLYETVREGAEEYVQEKLGGNTAPGSHEQSELIDALGLPEFMTSGLENNNNIEVYRYLTANTFSEYVADYLAVAVTNGVSFLLSFVLATLLIRMVTYALNIIARLPVLNGINRLAGCAVGLAKGLLFVWIALLVITIFCNTEVGRQCLALVEKDSVLSFLYEKDIFIDVFMNIFYGK